MCKLLLFFLYNKQFSTKCLSTCFQNQRTEIIHALLCNKPHISQDTENNVDIKDIAAKTEGYVAQDLSVLVDKATHAAWVRLGKL